MAIPPGSSMALPARASTAVPSWSVGTLSRMSNMQVVSAPVGQPFVASSAADSQFASSRDDDHLQQVDAQPQHPMLPAPCLASPRHGSQTPPAPSPTSKRAAGHMRVASAPVGNLFVASAEARSQSAWTSQAADGFCAHHADAALGDFHVVKAETPKDWQDAGECSPGAAVGRSWSVASEVLRSTYLSIDANGDGEVSKLELISAIKKQPTVAKYILPGLESNNLMEQEDVYDAFYEAFDSMAGGKRRATWEDFLAFVRRTHQQDEEEETRYMFKCMDKDRNGSISKFEFVSAAREYPQVASLAGVSCQDVLSSEADFDAVSAAFNDMACGKKRADFADFAAFAQKRRLAAASVAEVQRSPEERAHKKVLFLGCQGDIGGQHVQEMVKAGFSMHWQCNLPVNPEQPGFPMSQVLMQIKASISDLKPDAVMCSSRGGIYVSALLREGLWSGPTLMLNAHPSCINLPKNVRILVAHGENDALFRRSRAELERLATSGSPNMCYLHFVGNSGVLPGFGYSRPGDDHRLMSLVTNDTLPRLLDATLSTDCPEMHMQRSSLSMLSIQRRKAEQWLGYTPDSIRRLWSLGGSSCRTRRNLAQVEPSTKEWAAVEAVFKAVPNERAAYGGSSAETWDRIRLLRVERVQNIQQAERGSKPYLEAVKASVESQGLHFEPGVQTRWAFHGTSAVESIVSDPIAGFQPLTAGTKGQSLWGCGTYFARDAKYVLDGSFGGPPAADGTRRMLLCLITVGMYCQGDPRQHGILPMRRYPHRYDSAVDSLSSPEVHILQHSGAAYPAYVLTYV